LAKSSAAIGEPSCRPEFVAVGGAGAGAGNFVDFKELRHPTLCLSTNLRSFIPNDVKMGGDVGKVILLTGKLDLTRNAARLYFLFCRT
jgi:DNA mismatch repair protein MSH6